MSRCSLPIAVSACGPRLPRWAEDQVGSYLRYTGRAANVVATAAFDPMLTWARHTLCGAAIRGAGKLNPFSQGWRCEGVVVPVPRFFAQGNSQHSYTVDFDIKWPRPRRDMNKDPGWGLNGKVSRIDFVKLPEIRVVRSAVDVALDHAVQR